MEPHIIIKSIDPAYLTEKALDKNPIIYLKDIAVCDDTWQLKVFPSFDAAVKEMEDNGISGQVYELPLDY